MISDYSFIMTLSPFPCSNDFEHSWCSQRVFKCRHFSLLFPAEFRAVRGNEPGPGLRTVAPGPPATRLRGRKRQPSGKMDDGPARSRQLRVQSFVGVAASSFTCPHPPESHLPEQQSVIGDGFTSC